MFAGLAGTAHAQEAIEPAGDQTIEGGDDIVVTGSRIGRPVLDLPTPVGVVTSDAHENNNAQFEIGRALAPQPSTGFSASMQQSHQSGAPGSRGQHHGSLPLGQFSSLRANRTTLPNNGQPPH